MPRWLDSAWSFSQLSSTIYWHIMHNPITRRSATQAGMNAVRPCPSTAAVMMPAQAT
jgi:hypothetical protein